jgi:hypothetical protein
MDELEREREITEKLVEVVEVYLVRLWAQQSVIQTLVTQSIADEVVEQSAANYAPIAHELLKPLLADIRGMPLEDDPPMNLEEVARKLIESAKNPPPD